MTRKMLINAQTPEELRLAIVTDSTLDTYQVEAAEGGLTRGNIYRGFIANVQPSLNAAFVDYGAERNGFLAIQDVVEQAWYHTPKKKGGRPKIEEVLDRGKPIVVQVTREPEGQKGAALTTNLSLAGRYLVLTPFDDTRGVSRKVENEEDRKRLKKLATQLKVPRGCGAIMRTNAIDQNKTTLSRDLAALLRLWKQVQDEARHGKSTLLLYSDQDLVLQALRDYLDNSIEEVLVDSDEAYHKAQEYLRAFLPRGKTRLVRYQERTPLFSKFNLEPQIDRIYERRVELPSGGSVVIDRTEALTAIDVNSGRSTRGANQEETALHTNLEAATEVGRQLRLRDIGGLLVVDFIDMRSPKNRRRVEKGLREAMKDDKARSRVGRISANGLLEINRQRIHQALSLRTHRPCPTCDGTGRIASAEMVGLSLLRRIEARAATGTLQKVRIALHPELADAFQNGRRQEIAAIEKEFDIHVEVVSAGHLHRPEQEVDWFSRPRAAGRTAAVVQPAEPSVRVTDVTAPGKERSTSPAAANDGETPTAKNAKKRRRRKRSGRKSDAAASPPDKSADEGDKKARDARARDSSARDTQTRETKSRETESRETESRETPPAAAESAREGSAEKKKRPRRRGRRRKGTAAAAPAESAAKQPDPSSAQRSATREPARDRAEESQSQEAVPAAGTPSRRRRSRRRQGTDATQEAESVSPGVIGSGSGRKARLESGSRPEPTSEPARQDKPEREPKPERDAGPRRRTRSESEAKPEREAGGNEGDTPTRRRRPRRRQSATDTGEVTAEVP